MQNFKKYAWFSPSFCLNIAVNLVSVLRSQEPQGISLFSGIKTNLSRGKIPDTFLVA